MTQSLSYLIQRLKPYWLQAGGAAFSWEINRIIYLPIAGGAVTYEKTAANLTIALAGMAANEIVQIHGPCTLTGDFTIPAGAILMSIGRSEVNLAGLITLGNDSVIYNLVVSHTANDANALYGVVGPITGTGYIYYCDISAVQSGSGNAYAIGAINGTIVGNGDLVVRHSKLYGSSVSGSGYAGRSTNGYIYSRHNDYYGSTDRWAFV